MKEFDDDLEYVLEAERREYEELGKNCDKTIKYVIIPLGFLFFICGFLMLIPYIHRDWRIVANWYDQYYQRVLNKP